MQQFTLKYNTLDAEGYQISAGLLVTFEAHDLDEALELAHETAKDQHPCDIDIEFDSIRRVESV